jgi:hypothetical protein
MVSYGFFKKGEVADICLCHLKIDGEMTTRELAERVMIERNLDATDIALRNAVVFKVVQALRHAARRKLVRMVEKRKGMCLWAVGDGVTLRVFTNSRTTPGLSVRRARQRSTDQPTSRCSPCRGPRARRR